MRVLTASILGLLGGRRALTLLALTFAFYVLLARTAASWPEPASWREILYTAPVVIISVLLALSALSGPLAGLLERGLRIRVPHVLFYISIAVLTSSLWVSMATRFEGRALRFEGQSFNAFLTDYVPESVYPQDAMGGLAKLPHVGFTLLKINPETSADAKKIKRVTVDVLYASRTTDGVREGRLSSKRPFVSDWTVVRVTDFGYSLRYELGGLSGERLESRWLNMKLFPPGAEEYFEPMFLGYVVYFRLYPDFVERDGKPWTSSAYPKNPAYNVRVVRNKDIVFDGLLRPGKKLVFENHVLELPETRMYVELTFVRDLGLFVAAGGLLLMLISVAWMAASKTVWTRQSRLG